MDHTYSITQETLDRDAASPASSIDEEYEFGNHDRSHSDMEDECFSEPDDTDEEEEAQMRKERHAGKAQAAALKDSLLRVVLPLKRKFQAMNQEVEEDEELKIVEGADALLNLAGIINTPMRSISPSSCHSNNNNNNTIDIKLEVKPEPEAMDQS